VFWSDSIGQSVLHRQNNYRNVLQLHTVCVLVLICNAELLKAENMIYVCFSCVDVKIYGSPINCSFVHLIDLSRATSYLVDIVSSTAAVILQS